MKHTAILLTTVFVLIFSFEGFSFSSNLPEVVKAKKAMIETNLLDALTSGNAGLMQSAAYYLGEFKSEKAIIPLMKMLHSDCCDGLRVTAALSLTKIGTGKSLYAVKQCGTFDHSSFVKRFCTQFYSAAKEK